MNSTLFIICQVLMWGSIFLLIYTYLIFPFLLSILARNKKGNTDLFSRKDDLPHISILMSLFNEESVIIDKLNTLKKQHYPTDKIHVYIGSDNSSDLTNEMVESFIKKNDLSYFYFHPYYERQGKPGVINQLYEKAIDKINKDDNHILIITDASVLLEENTLFHLAKHFKNKNIGLVDSFMKHIGIQKEGISKSEDTYISKEVHIKRNEGLVNGKMMGPFGGCYAIRANLYKQVPSTFLVDDFFLAMHVLENGKNAINEPNAICLEFVSQEMSEEYRRKKRISAGNFQNLVTYWKLLLPDKGSIAFNFWGHKVLRWLGPFLIITSYLTNVALCFSDNLFYSILLSFQTVLIFIIPIFDLVLKRIHVHISIFRSIRYFFMMNLALLEGFINYIKGVKSNVWQPTKRPDSTEHHS